MVQVGRQDHLLAACRVLEQVAPGREPLLRGLDWWLPEQALGRVAQALAPDQPSALRVRAAQTDWARWDLLVEQPAALSVRPPTRAPLRRRHPGRSSDLVCAARTDPEYWDRQPVQRAPRQVPGY